MATGSPSEIEEELRLTYVAMTRARDFLYVLWPQRYYIESAGLTDRHTYAQCCRFFSASVLCTMDTVESGRSSISDHPVSLGSRRDILPP